MMEEKKWAKKRYSTGEKESSFVKKTIKKKISIKLNEIQEKKEMGNRIKKKYRRLG